MITTINEFKKINELNDIDIQYNFKKSENDEWDYDLELSHGGKIIGIVTFWMDRYYPGYLCVGDANIYVDEFRGKNIYQNALYKTKEIAKGMGLKGIASGWASRNYIATKAWDKIKDKRKNNDNDYFLESKINEEFGDQKDYNHKDYLKWKRKNVTIRGMAEIGNNNGAGAQFGDGLYTAFLSNKELAKKYGKVHFVVNAIPKKPLVFNTIMEAENWIYYNLYKQFRRVAEFNKVTTIDKEIQKLGYDGIIISGREMVNYKPENVMYFKNEEQLKDYYDDNIH